MKLPSLLFMWLVSNALVSDAGRSFVQVRSCVQYHTDTQMEKQWYEILKTEKGKCSQLKNAWDKASEWWAMQKPSLKKEYALALYAYTLNDRSRGYNLPTLFNNQLESYVANTQSYQANFQYKSLHYYLSAALEELNKRAGGKRVTVYKGNAYKGVLQSGKCRQFESFTSTSTNKLVAEDFTRKNGKAVEDPILYHISTSQGASITAYSANVSQHEWLIAPCTSFMVEKVNKSMIQGRARRNVFLKSPAIIPSPSITFTIILLLAQYIIFC